MGLIHVDVPSLSFDGIKFGYSCFQYTYSLQSIRTLVFSLSYLDATELEKAICDKGTYLNADNE